MSVDGDDRAVSVRSEDRERDTERDDRDREESEPEERGKSEQPAEEFKIFVGGISWHMDDRELKDTFRKYGAVDARVMLDRVTSRSRGFGFVHFDNEDDLKDAVEKMHDADIDGRKISVTRAIPQDKIQPGTPAHALSRGDRYREERYRGGGGGGGYDRGYRGGGGYDRGYEYDRYDRRGGGYDRDYRNPYSRGGYDRGYGGGDGGYDRGYERDAYAYESSSRYDGRDRYGPDRGYGQNSSPCAMKRKRSPIGTASVAAQSITKVQNLHTQKASCPNAGSENGDLDDDFQFKPGDFGYIPFILYHIESVEDQGIQQICEAITGCFTDNSFTLLEVCTLFLDALALNPASEKTYFALFECLHSTHSRFMYTFLQVAWETIQDFSANGVVDRIFIIFQFIGLLGQACAPECADCKKDTHSISVKGPLCIGVRAKTADLCGFLKGWATLVVKAEDMPDRVFGNTTLDKKLFRSILIGNTIYDYGYGAQERELTDAGVKTPAELSVYKYLQQA